MTKLELIITGFDFASSQQYVVSLSNSEVDIPRSIINKERNHDFVIKEILTDLVNLDVNWIIWNIKSVKYSDSDVILVFSCEIPFETKLNNAYWMKYV